MNDEPITDEKLAELEALCEAATPPPWVWYDGCSWRRMHSESDIRKSKPVLEPYIASDRHPDMIAKQEDQRFIAAAREALPSLIKRVRELEKAKDVEQRMLDMVVAMAATSSDKWLPNDEIRTLARELCEERAAILKGEPC